MENNELKNTDTELESAGSSSDSIVIAAGAVGVSMAIAMFIKSVISDRALKREREKNKLYQEAILRHQAEIDALKHHKEREEYKNRLWEELHDRQGE